jgi:hypothetical protein
MKYGPKKARLVVSNRIGGKAVGWKCILPGCTWRASADNKPEADIQFKKHVAAKHPPKAAKKTTRKREDFSQAAVRIVREATKQS